MHFSRFIADASLRLGPAPLPTEAARVRPGSVLRVLEPFRSLGLTSRFAHLTQALGGRQYGTAWLTLSGVSVGGSVCPKHARAGGVCRGCLAGSGPGSK